METTQVSAPEYGQYYKDICLLGVPLIVFACYLYGPRPLLLCLAGVLTGNLCDRIISLLRRRPYLPEDLSNESFGMIIALLMPVTVRWSVLVMAVLAGVLLGKEVFGGYGSYPFHPAAVGYAVAAVSWPEQVLYYPQPNQTIPLWDASGVPTAPGIYATLRSGGMPNISWLSLILGEYAGPIGVGASLIILACGLILLVRRDIHWSAGMGFLLSSALIAYAFPQRVDLIELALNEGVSERLQVVATVLLSGATLFTAIFLLNEPFTCSRRRLGRFLYGLLVGCTSMFFRYFGAYETGVCFALLLVNGVSEWLDEATLRLYQLLKYKRRRTLREEAEDR